MFDVGTYLLNKIPRWNNNNNTFKIRIKSVLRRGSSGMKASITNTTVVAIFISFENYNLW